jgi:hypothetical protein
MFEDTKGVIRSRKLEERQYNGQKKRTKRQTMVYKALHRKLKIKQHESHKKSGLKASAPEELVVPASLATPALLLLNDTSIY